MATRTRKSIWFVVKDAKAMEERCEVHRWPLSYYPGLSEKVAAILRKVGKEVSLRPQQKFGGLVFWFQY